MRFLFLLEQDHSTCRSPALQPETLQPAIKYRNGVTRTFHCCCNKQTGKHYFSKVYSCLHL